jgi:hypothetical protein
MPEINVKGHKFYECSRCCHIWPPRGKEKPKWCPDCNSPYWDKQRKRRMIKNKS